MSSDGEPRHVLICDDHEVLRHGLRAVFRQAPDLTVVAEAADADEALSLAARLRPDVTLVGLGTQGATVQRLVRTLTGMGLPVVLLSGTDDADDLVEALSAGARGCVHTTVSPTRLVEGVRAVARGETVLDACVAGELLHRLDGVRQAGEGSDRSCSGQLTARQLRVADLVAEGLSNAEIAARLRVSRATVKGHITVALRRLGLRDRTQLAIHVHRTGRPTDRGEGRSPGG
ncbi:response regulator [Geodermatophilus sp. CPCC 206100]|uniref:response regulator n=1 Tax=Geodermatophilus sp. CPCC 206100 TaxID=3020054 RepID=UPI003B00C3DE